MREPLIHPTKTIAERSTRGNAGDDGFVQLEGGGVVHWSRPYGAADHEVFVKAWIEDGDGGRDPWYERLPASQAAAEGRRVILCNSCLQKPASTLDHLYPYDLAFNRCDDCREAKLVVWNRDPADYPDGLEP